MSAPLPSIKIEAVPNFAETAPFLSPSGPNYPEVAPGTPPFPSSPNLPEVGAFPSSPNLPEVAPGAFPSSPVPNLADTTFAFPSVGCVPVPVPAGFSTPNNLFNPKLNA